MKIGRVILAGLAVDALSVLIPLPSYWLFRGVFELPPAEVWKWTPLTPAQSLSGGFIAFVVAANTVLAILFAAAYAAVRRALPGPPAVRGAAFGLLVYPIGVLIPLFSMYVLLRVNGLALLYFAGQGLVEFVAYGAAAGWICGAPTRPAGR